MPQLSSAYLDFLVYGSFYSWRFILDMDKGNAQGHMVFSRGDPCTLSSYNRGPYNVVSPRQVTGILNSCVEDVGTCTLTGDPGGLVGLLYRLLGEASLGSHQVGEVRPKPREFRKTLAPSLSIEKEVER